MMLPENADRLTERLRDSDVPNHLHDGLMRYFAQGILPGSFLQAVLTGSWERAILRADSFSLRGLPALVRFLQMECPAEAWGSRARVAAWTTTPSRLEP